MVGAMDDRGRLPGARALAMGQPSASWVSKLKSVSSLFRRNPCAMTREPKPFSIVVVIDKALPWLSTIEIWVVEGSSSALS